MRRVLLIAYYFPPIGGAGAQRPMKFVRHLPTDGYEPVVITGPGNSIGRWTPPDATLAAEVDDATKVLRLPGPEPLRRSDWKGKAQRWLGLRSEWTQWWVEGAVRAGHQIDEVDLVYAWMSPYQSAEAAVRLAIELGKPWVADLGDPWALDEMMVFPTAAHRLRELRRMRQLLGSAAAVVMSTPEAAAQVRKAFPELSAKPIVSIPNGFDASDFEGDVTPPDDRVLRIVHTGYLHTELGRQQRRTARVHRLLGGERKGVDILTRSHIYLLEAIERLLHQQPELRSRIEVHLAGVLSEADLEVAGRSPVVRHHGYLSHAESIALVRAADLLFLPMQNLPPGPRSTTVPGKTYEYAASGRPILAAIPDGDARDLLEACGNAFVCRPDDVGAMTRIIADRLAQPTGESDSKIRDKALLERFEYRYLSGRLAAVFDGVADVQEATARPFVPVTDGRIRPRAKGRDRAPKKALHIAYYFPPIGGAGAQRTLKFVRYLPLFGYESTVITGSGEAGGRWTPADETLTEEVGPETEVWRVPGPEPVSAGWTGRAERWFRLPSPWSSWWTEGVLRIARDVEDVDVILASMSPYQSAEAAAQLAAELDKPWVAGLRDPWALDEMMVFPSAAHRLRELRRMRTLLASAAAIVVTTQEAVERVHDAFPELRAKPVVSIPNGFDASDFGGNSPARDDDLFRIVHTGYLHTELGRRQRRTAGLRRLLGGETKGVDILTRSHVYLLKAIDRLIERDPSLSERIEVHLAGVLSSVDRKIAGRSKLVRVHGYVPHAESIRLIRSADLLFLPMQNLPPGARSSTVPGKTYEYLASGRPILAAVPDGDTHDILAAAGNCRFSSPDDSASMADAIEAEVNRWRTGSTVPEPAPDVLRRYERRFLTEELAALMDVVTTLQTPARRGRLREGAPQAARGGV